MLKGHLTNYRLGDTGNFTLRGEKVKQERTVKGKLRKRVCNNAIESM